MIKRFLSIAALGLVAGTGVLVSCADPLESTGPDNSSEPIYIVDTVPDFDTLIQIDTTTRIDTVYVVDSVIQGDTIIQFDTVTIVDTLIQTDTVVVIDTLVDQDTVTQIDTVFIVVPDTGSIRPFCSVLACNQQEIVWMFRNPDGAFRLEFTADMEKDQPNQTLTVDIDGQTFLWDPNAAPEFITELHLDLHATMRIVANKPPARGHSINVCLTVTEL